MAKPTKTPLPRLSAPPPGMMAFAEGWFASPAYQALIPIRTQAAEVTLISYEI